MIHRSVFSHAIRKAYLIKEINSISTLVRNVLIVGRRGHNTPAASQPDERQ